MWIATGDIADLAIPRQFIVTTIAADHASVFGSAVPTVIAHAASIMPLAVITDQAPSAAAADQTPTVVPRRIIRQHDGSLSLSGDGGANGEMNEPPALSGSLL